MARRVASTVAVDRVRRAVRRRGRRRTGRRDRGQRSGRGERVTGGDRGAAAAARPLRSWAGPWLIDQRWWEPLRHRRLAQFQVVTDDGDAYLVAAERQRWWILAAYA